MGERSAFLLAQLENLDVIQNRRKIIWNMYYDGLKKLEKHGLIRLPDVPGYATNNAHMFYFVCRNLDERTKLIAYLKENGILAVFHYLSLHLSGYYKDHSDLIPVLPNCDHFADCLVRLPMYYELTDDNVVLIINRIFEFCKNK